LFSLLRSLLLGYLITQRTARRDRLAKSYAEALAAVAAYEELPYRICCRAGANYREELSRRASDVHESLFFHRAWIKLESESSGDAYDSLVRTTKEKRRQPSQARVGTAHGF
jgi:hypothetical protein